MEADCIYGRRHVLYQASHLESHIGMVVNHSHFEGRQNLTSALPRTVSILDLSLVLKHTTSISWLQAVR